MKIGYVSEQGLGGVLNQVNLTKFRTVFDMKNRCRITKTESALRGQVATRPLLKITPPLPEILTGSEPCSLIEPIFISGHILRTDFLKISVRDENRLC